MSDPQQAFQYLVIQGAKIGEGTKIGHNVIVFDRGVIGKNCNIQNNTEIYNGVEIGDDVFIGPHVCFTNDLTPRAYENKGGEFVKTKVGKGVSIGANSTIVCGITIGDYAAIGAGSVVTKDVPPGVLVYGNPARVQRKLKTKNNRWQ